MCPRVPFGAGASGTGTDFAFTFELAWKTLKDLLYADGLTENSPRGTLRQGHQQSYLKDGACEVLMEALDNRNLMARAYDEESALLAEDLLKTKYFPTLERLDELLKARLNP